MKKQAFPWIASSPGVLAAGFLYPGVKLWPGAFTVQ
jgi:hypothetical protein